MWRGEELRHWCWWRILFLCSGREGREGSLDAASWKSKARILFSSRMERVSHLRFWRLLFPSFALLMATAVLFAKRYYLNYALLKISYSSGKRATNKLILWIPLSVELSLMPRRFYFHWAFSQILVNSLWRVCLVLRVSCRMSRFRSAHVELK